MNIKGRLFIRMKLPKHLDSKRQRPLRADHLQADFVSMDEFALLANDRGRAFTAEERAEPLQVERAPFVVADGSRADGRQRIAHRLNSRSRNKRDDFVCLQGVVDHCWYQGASVAQCFTVLPFFSEHVAEPIGDAAWRCV